MGGVMCGDYWGVYEWNLDVWEEGGDVIGEGDWYEFMGG